jgi:transcriptional regulator
MVLENGIKLVLFFRPIFDYRIRMYLPKHFEVTDPTVLWQLIQEFNFALLVTAPDGLPFASAVPFVVNREQNLLSTHLAKANPQWKHLEPDREVLIVFQAEHALISSRWYAVHPNVPTWNYATVHAYATPRVLDAEGLSTQVEALMRQHGHDADLRALPEEYLTGMKNRIVGIEFTVTRLEGKFKLDQSKTSADRQGVIPHLETQGDLEQGIARRMRELEMGSGNVLEAHVVDPIKGLL